MRGLEYLGSNRKRSLDIVGASTLLAALAVPVAVGAGTALATEGRPVIFRHPRLGRDLTPLIVTKIRSMIDNAHIREPDYLSADDHRITPIGSVLRRTCIDETPQLWTILKGEMSLVGPRPISSKDLERHKLAAPALYSNWLEAYRAAKPGLLGLGQLVLKSYKEHSPEVIAERMEADIDYVATASLSRDVKIIADTVHLLGHNVFAGALDTPHPLPLPEDTAA